MTIKQNKKKKERSLHNVHRERVLLTAGNYLEIYIHNQDIFQILFGLKLKVYFNLNNELGYKFRFNHFPLHGFACVVVLFCI